MAPIPEHPEAIQLSIYTDTAPASFRFIERSVAFTDEAIAAYPGAAIFPCVTDTITFKKDKNGNAPDRFKRSEYLALWTVNEQRLRTDVQEYDIPYDELPHPGEFLGSLGRVVAQVTSLLDEYPMHSSRWTVADHFSTWSNQPIF